MRVLTLAAVCAGITGRDRQHPDIDLEQTTLRELQTQRKAVADFERRFQPQQHDVKPARLELDNLSSGDFKPIERTHAHDVALHFHAVNLHRLRNVGVHRDQPVIFLAAFELQISAPN